MRENANWLGVNKTEVYFWLLLNTEVDSRGLVLASTLSSLFYLVAPLTVLSISKVASLFRTAAKAPSIIHPISLNRKEKGKGK